MKRNARNSSFLQLPKIKQYNGNENQFNVNRINHLQLSTAYLFNKHEPLPEKLKEKVTHIMEDYKYDAIDEEKPSDLTNILQPHVIPLYKKEKEDIMKIYCKTNRFPKSQSTASLLNNNSSLERTTTTQNQNIEKITFNIKEEVFKTPIQSYNIVQKNRIIYENLMENYENVEYDRYKTTYTKINALLNSTKQTSKIKITPRIPKMIETTNALKEMLNKKCDSTLMKSKSNALVPTDRKITTVELITKFAYGQKSFPESREQFTFSIEGNELLIHGGLLTNKSTIIWKLNPINFTWTKIIAENLISLPRYGHTAVLYHRKLIIFGGRYFDSLNLYGDVDIFNLDTYTWSSPSLFTTMKQVRLRRNHVACSIGSQMFIHGGIDNDGNYLNEPFLLNLNPPKWIPCQISTFLAGPILAFHSCCAVLQEEFRLNAKTTVYRLPEINVTKIAPHKIRERGIYIFGGKHTETGPINNLLWVLRIAKPQLEWVRINTRGEGPSPRFSSSLTYYEEGNCLVVHGGRNDKSSENFALNDTYIIDLWNLNWCRVVYYYENNKHLVSNRCSHSSMIHGHKLIIFGGMNSDKYIGSSICIIELDSKEKVINRKTELHHNPVLNAGMTAIKKYYSSN